MSRTEWILGILIVAALVVVGVVAVLFFANQSNSGDLPVITPPGTPRERAAEVAPTSIFQGQTALLAFAAAQQDAVQWAADATLVSVTATWPQGSTRDEMLTGQNSWGVTFYSAERSAVAAYSVVEGSANLLGVDSIPASLQPLGTGGWRLDSPDVVEQFLIDAGDRFLSDEVIVTLTMSLTTDNASRKTEWLVSLFAPSSGRSLIIRYDAASGELLEMIPPPAS